MDLLNLEDVRDAFRSQQPDVIYNCAAHVGSLHYVTEFAATVVHDNLQMALNLYRAAQDVCPDAHIINPLSNCSYPGRTGGTGRSTRRFCHTEPQSA